MAKGFVGVAMRAAKAAQREHTRQANAAIRNHNAALKDDARAAKAREAEMKRISIADERDRKHYEKALKAAHAEAQLAEVECLNAEISQTFDDLEGLLRATIDVDDYIDLQSLRQSENSTPFDKPELEKPLEPPKMLRRPNEPTFRDPPQPKGFFGKKKKLEAAIASETERFNAHKRQWKLDVAKAEADHQSKMAVHLEAESKRVDDLAREQERFRTNIELHNKRLDSFITNLSYGDAEALQEYISMVVESSIYPDHFEVEHDFSFDPSTAELKMSVSIPPPSAFPSIKSYKYVKTSDEIRETPLSVTERKSRYSSAIYQVSIRSLHEVFEADRRDLVQTISLEVGTMESDPATGKTGFLPFVGVSAQKAAFMEFDLSGLVPLATLKHLGASISKDPLGLVLADVSGVRKS